MARRRLSDTSHPDTSLDDAYWLRFGDQPQPPMRDKIIYLTAEEVAKVGPAVFNVASVSDRLGITHPMVNHYFGGRDGLLAETAFVVYQRYIRNLWEAVAAAPADPRARLRAWMMQQIESTAKLGGWGGILNYPSSSMHVSGLLQENFGDQIRDLFVSNTVRLGILVEDLRSGDVTSFEDLDIEALRVDFLGKPEVMERGSSVALSTLGVAIWNAGQHLPTRGAPELDEHKDQLIAAHVQRVINAALT